MSAPHRPRRLVLADPSTPLRPEAGFTGARAVVVHIPLTPEDEDRHAREQGAIAAAVEGVIP